MRKALYIVTILLMTAAPYLCGAQSYLSKGVSVKAKQKTVEEVLNIISKQGGFFFSYNSNIVPADSVIDIDVWNKTVKQTLDIIFKGRFEYKETPNHIIIQLPSSGQYWYVSGYIVDENTGERMRDVSVFESGQLVASLTNDVGYFKLKLKDKTPATVINIRKSMYNDTLITIKPGVDQEVKVSLKPKNYELDAVVISSKDNIEGTWFGKAFLSSRQRIQSMNLNKFFVDMPVQGSVVPGLSSQGRMSSQAVNKFSFNMLGGYTAGVEGAEIGGVFNMNKKDVRYLQVAGVINIVGGNVVGTQVAGVHNNVLTGVRGVQVAGASNMARGAVEGMQISGAYNHASKRVTGGQVTGAVNYANDTVDGVQVSGAVNIARKDVGGVQVTGAANLAKNVDGAQISGGANIARGTVDGAQVSGGFNFAKKLDGVQIGLVNYADSSSGTSIGLFSFVRKGYHKASLSANEAMLFNLSFKSGTGNLYNIYTAGADISGGSKAFCFGLGYGSEFKVAKRISLSPELTGNIVYLGNWAEVNPMIKLGMHVNIHITKWLAVYGGPTFNMYWDNLQPQVEGYKTNLLPAGYKINSYNANLSSWVGWNAGITFF